MFDSAHAFAMYRRAPAYRLDERQQTLIKLERRYLVIGNAALA